MGRRTPAGVGWHWCGACGAIPPTPLLLELLQLQWASRPHLEEGELQLLLMRGLGERAAAREAPPCRQAETRLCLR